MADIDKLMGWRGDQPVFGSYRIDYDSTDDIRSDNEFSGASKSPPPDHRVSDVKDGYQRKIVVENSTVRDETTSYLDSEGINYTVEDISPTAQERQHITREKPMNEEEAVKALNKMDAIDQASTLEELKDVQRGIHPVSGEMLEEPERKG